MNYYYIVYHTPTYFHQYLCNYYNQNGAFCIPKCHQHFKLKTILVCGLYDLCFLHVSDSPLPVVFRDIPPPQNIS